MKTVEYCFVKYYSAIKMKEVLICATKQMRPPPLYNVKYPLQINSQRWNKDYYLPDAG